MKFRCGDCGSYYLLEGRQKLRKKRSLRCLVCDNVFVIAADSFFSSKRNSQLICNACGRFIEEADAVCSCKCSAEESSVREAQRIDNKNYYYFVVRKGRIQPKYRKVNWFARGLLLAGAIILATGILIIINMPGSKRDALKNAVLKTLHLPSTTETQIVIMRSGKVYYAEHIEYHGVNASITLKNGNLILIRKQDIQQIRKAVIED
jgi:hypothetical protein